MWRARQWRRLLNLIDHLPSYSFFNEARANDRELAEVLAGEPAPEYTERLSQWTPEMTMLAQVVDRLGSVINATVVMNGGKKLDIKPVPRPVTEIQLARERDTVTRHDQFVRRMTAPD